MICLTTSLFVVSAEQDYGIPDWIKNNAGWWANDQIDDGTFLNAMKFLIENNILVVSSQTDNSPKTTIDVDRFLDQQALTNPFLGGIRDGVIKVYLHPLPSYATAEAEEAVRAFTEALNFPVSTSNQFPDVKIVNDKNDAHIQIDWIKHFGGESAGVAIFKSFIQIGLGDDTCTGYWQPYNKLTVLHILWHEFGHGIGFGHSSDPNNVMHPTLKTQYEYDYNKSLALDEGEYSAIPLCSEGKYRYNIVNDDQENGFYAFVVPPTTNPGKFVYYQEGTYYPDCSTVDPMYEFGRTCDNVPSNSHLIIYNQDEVLNTSIIRPHIEIINLNPQHIPDWDWDMTAFQYSEELIESFLNYYN